MNRAALILPLLLTAPLAVACDEETQVAEAPPAGLSADLRARVAFEPVAAAAEMTLVNLPAEVVLPSDAVRELAPPLPGRLAAWSVKLGDTIEEGAALATVDSPELTDLASAEQELASIVRARRRVVSEQRKQMAAGLTTAQQVQIIELSLREAKARLAAVQQQLAVRRSLGAGEGAGDEAGGDTGGPSASWTWRAPSAGAIEAIDCPAGGMVSPEDPCVTVMETGRAELLVRIPERYLGDLGAAPKVAFTPASRSARRLLLTLSRRAPSLDAPSRTRAHYFVAGAADAQARAALVPGASGRAELMSEPPRGVRAVRAEAVTRFEGEDVVFVAAGDAPSEAAPVKVDVVGRHGEHLLVRGALPDGARVAVRGVFLLKSLRALGEE